MDLHPFLVRPLVEQAIREELGPGDTTGGFLVDQRQRADAQIYAKQDGVIAGLLLAEESIRAVDPEAVIRRAVRDGDMVRAGDTLLQVEARAFALFIAERVALDWLQYLSGIATRTRRYVELVRPYGTRLTDTRKGVPGLRVLQKYAVRVGGAHNHLFGLHNAVLVKDNHIKAAGGIAEAVRLLRSRVQHTFKIELECETLEQVEEALKAGVEIIMFDNMTLENIRSGVKLVGGKAEIEASGGINETTIVPIAETGVDIISVGEITHSVRALDISLDIAGIKPSALRQIAENKAGLT
ncbi:MAG: carboxylating nicotinate-nucleotide diphosphorylase [Desulfovibrio sp.]|jgi:nicotinate-nucleotide pyrophosphorylase (carboxylating)|nr:carboxylating nicotinate-nucleotide diphosphorylase [Desulfovibrio sp.]